MAISHYIDGDLALNIARGLTRARSVNKFGANPSISINTTATVWDVSDTVYPWSAFDTAGVLTIPAVNASDNGATVTVLGLDQNFNEISEEFVVSSAGTVTGTKTFKRVYRAYFTDSGDTNVGNINVQRGGTTVLRITDGKAQTLMAIYTVPAGYTAYLIQGTMTLQSGADATGDLFIRYNGQNTFRVGHSFEVSSSQYMYNFAVPVAIPEKSDIDVRADVRSNNARVTAAFDIILIPN